MSADVDVGQPLEDAHGIETVMDDEITGTGKSRRRHRLTGVAVAAVVMVLGVVAAVGLSRRSEPAPVAAPVGDSGLTVSVASTRGLGPLRATAGEPTGPTLPNSTAWRQHQLVFENTSDEPVYVFGLNGTGFASPGSALWVADDRCGPPDAGCIAPGIMWKVPPHAAISPGDPPGSAAVSLWRQGPVEPGRYTFRMSVGWSHTAPSEGPSPSETGEIELLYEVTG